MQPDGRAQLARAAAAVLHPWRRRWDHQRQPQQASLRRVPRTTRDLDRAGRSPHRGVLRRPAALCRARRGLLRAPPGAGREQPSAIGGRGRSLLTPPVTNWHAGDVNTQANPANARALATRNDKENSAMEARASFRQARTPAGVVLLFTAGLPASSRPDDPNTYKKP